MCIYITFPPRVECVWAPLVFLGLPSPSPSLSFRPGHKKNWNFSSSAAHTDVTFLTFPHRSQLSAHTTSAGVLLFKLHIERGLYTGWPESQGPMGGFLESLTQKLGFGKKSDPKFWVSSCKKVTNFGFLNRTLIFGSISGFLIEP